MAPANSWVNIHVSGAPEVLGFMVMEVDLIGLIFLAIKDQSVAEGAGNHKNIRIVFSFSTALVGVKGHLSVE